MHLEIYFEDHEPKWSILRKGSNVNPNCGENASSYLIKAVAVILIK